jgi:uncharacterized membrane protein
VLAIPRWKPVLAWMTVDALLWVPRMAYYLSPEHKGLPIEPYLGAVLIRDAAVLFLVALVLRDIYRPAVDPVRAPTTHPDMETYRGHGTLTDPDMSPYR